MIDRPKRDRLAEALRQLLSGRIDNLAFDDLDCPGNTAVSRYELPPCIDFGRQLRDCRDTPAPFCESTATSGATDFAPFGPRADDLLGSTGCWRFSFGL